MTDQGSVVVRIPADPANVPLLRTTVAGVGARQAFTIEQLDDLRMGVEEAAVLLLRRGIGEPIELHLDVLTDGLALRLSTPATGSEPPVDTTSFSWVILTALADDVEARLDDGIALIRLAKYRGEDLPA